MTTAIIFPGQGSQTLGMGKGLFEKYRSLTEKTSRILEFDIEELCLQGPSDNLNSTDNTQCAIFFVNALHYIDWKASHSILPSYLLGHSIGEYNAMLAAEMITFEDALKLVKLRGELMAKQRGGAMAAIMKIPATRLLELLELIPGGELVDIANFNSEYQTVISTSEMNLEKITHHLQEADALVVRLNTSGAFHSRYMENAKQDFQTALSKIDFRPAKIPVISNVSAEFLTEPSDLQASHLTSPVKWYQSIYQILEQDEDTEFVECGWGSTLRNILRYNKKEFLARTGLTTV